jgi:hypothetical protein
MDSNDEEELRRNEKHNYRTITNFSSYTDTIATNFKTCFDLSLSGSVIDAIRRFGTLIKRDENEINEVIKLFLKRSTDHHPSLCIYAYTRQTFLVYKMNDCIRSDNKEHLNAIYPYVNILMNGLKLYPFHGTVYRGFLLNAAQLAKYQKDRTFFWPAFSSTSKNFTISAHFAQCNVVFEIIIPKAVSHCCGDISKKSAYREEEEVLLKPYTYFRVLDHKTRVDCGKMYTVPVLLVEATAFNLSGVWKSDDGGDYFVCQYGRKVFWHGRAGQNTRYNWSHVAHGIIDNREVIHLTFGDIPIGGDRYTGSIDIQVSNDYAMMTKILDSRNIFLTKSWKRVSLQYNQEFMPTVLPTFWSDNCDQMTGHWKCNDGGNYYISQFNEQIFWLGCHPKGQWCNVAVGKIDKASNEIDLDWGDIVCGSDRLYGTLKVLVKNNIIKKLKEQLMGLDENKFLGTEWRKTNSE